MSQRDINLFYGAFTEYDPGRGEVFTCGKDGVRQFFADPDELWLYLMEQRKAAGAQTKLARAPVLEHRIPRSQALQEAVDDYEDNGGLIQQMPAVRRSGALSGGDLTLTLDDIGLDELDFDE